MVSYIAMSTPPAVPQPVTRAAIYVRISRDYTGQKLGVARQQQDCERLAERLDWHIHHVYVDNDKSATSGAPRPAYAQMLDDINQGQVDAIIAWHPDRLYRRAIDLGELVEVCKTHATKVATVNAGDVDLTTPTGLLVAELLAAVSMYEVRHKTERWSRSFRQRREQGLHLPTASRMFGYQRDGTVIPAEAKIARRMAADVLAGIPLLVITEQLEQAGVRTTRGSTWRPATMRQYLTNPRVAGWSTIKGEIVADGDWDPVIDRETFEAVRAMLTARSRPFVPRKSLLNGLLHCAKCGHRMITSGQRGRRTYRCPNRPGMRGCGHVSGNAEPIEEFVEAYARRLYDRPEVRTQLRALSTTTSSTAAELVTHEQRLAELEQQLDEPGVPVTTILRAMDRIKDRIEDLHAQVAVATRPLPEIGNWPTELLARAQAVALVVDRVDLAPAARSGRQDFDTDRITVLPRTLPRPAS